MTRETALRVRDLVLEASKHLDQSVVAARAGQSPEEFLHYRDTVSRVLMMMLEEILNPMFVEHPDLKPKEWP